MIYYNMDKFFTAVKREENHMEKTLEQWRLEGAVFGDLMDLRETVWLNPALGSAGEVIPTLPVTAADVADASARLRRFAPYLAEVFPETAEAGGVIESPLTEAPAFQRALGYGPGKLLMKLDSHLPISGSIKARGGIYEVLCLAESLAVNEGMLSLEDDYRVLAQPRFREFFRQYAVAVGSTGNLGLSIGIMSAKLGFRVTVHMSADARQWKKDMLRGRGVTVVEYAGNYSRAVTEGRRQAASDPMCHFVDDENSKTLFLGYAVAAERLKGQLEARHIPVDQDHPLFVYLPCGVGGGPGGVAFGLKLLYGDSVHCFFAEPTHAPCMTLGLATGLHDGVSVGDFGIDGRTAADGLAVGRPSRFVGRVVERLISGCYTVDDNRLYRLLHLLAESEGIRLEPSALAGVPGMGLTCGGAAASYGKNRDISPENITHIAWATGGSMVPPEVWREYDSKGAALSEGR